MKRKKSLKTLSGLSTLTKVETKKEDPAIKIFLNHPKSNPITKNSNLGHPCSEIYSVRSDSLWTSPKPTLAYDENYRRNLLPYMKRIK